MTLSNPSPASTLRLGLVQYPAGESPEDNLHRALEGISEAASQGAHIVCLQELFLTPYFCQTEDVACFALAESVPGPTTKALSAKAREVGAVVIGSLFERRGAGVYHNTALVIDADGTLRGCYRKMHIPDDPGYYEKFYFTPGDTGFVSFQTRHARVGPLVCWDQWFPEAARLSVLGGAEILLYPTAIGWLRDEKALHGRAQHDAWEVVQRGHAIANGVFVAAVNRVGTEGAIEFWGSSFVCDPFGRVLARAPADRDAVLVVPCDLSLVEKTRREWPFLRDRRIDAYTGLSARLLDR